MDIFTPEFVIKVVITVSGFLVVLWRVAVWFGRQLSTTVQVHHEVAQLDRDLKKLDEKNDDAHERLQRNVESTRDRIEAAIERLARLEGRVRDNAK